MFLFLLNLIKGKTVKNIFFFEFINFDGKYIKLFVIRFFFFVKSKKKKIATDPNQITI